MKMLIKITKSLGYKNGLLISVTVLLYSLFSYVPIIFMEKLVDSVNISDSSLAIKTIIISACLYMFFQLLSQLFNALNNYYCDCLQNRYASKLKMEIFNNLIKTDDLYFKTSDFSKLTSSVLEDTLYISNNYYKSLIVILISIVNFIVGFIFMSHINLYLSLLIIPLGLITAICSKKMDVITQKNLEKQKVFTEKSWKLFGEGIKGIKLIKVFDNKQYIDSIAMNSDELSKVTIKQSFIDNFGGFVVGTLYMVTIGIILLISSIFVYKNIISFGGLVSMVMYNHMLVDPLLNFIESKQKLSKLKITDDRISTILNYKKLEKEKTYSIVEKIILRNVDFNYNTKLIFNNFSYTFKKGKKYCVTGKTGRGKSTLVNLISGYLTPNSGEVYYLNEKGEKIDNQIPMRISYLLQDSYLFNMSIEENIRIVNPEATSEQIKQLIDDCCLDEVYERVKYDIGDNGNLLSGGEKKRLLLAMALSKKDYDVIIFDELSSSLDKNTYFKILKNIDSYLENKIAIFVEHYHVDGEYYDEFIEL
jgi:ABC-type bacteriocin/lantibiotic exporter with double-glycine peptidase domain